MTARFFLAAALLTGSPGAAFCEGASDALAAGPVHTLDSLPAMSPEALEVLFTRSSPGELPESRVRGKVVRFEAWLLSAPISAFLNVLWSGKVFHPDSTLHNLVLGHKHFKGEVYLSESWLDGKPAWIIDYRRTSPSIGYIRDEFRHVGRGVYLGWTFDNTGGQEGKRFMLNFAIDSEPEAR